MLDLKTELIRLSLAFCEARIAYAVCGGIAVAIHGYPRATQDLDILVQPEDLAAVRRETGQLGYTIDGGILNLGKNNAAPIRLWRVSRQESEDLLTLDFILAEDWLLPIFEGRRRLVIQGTSLTVVSREGLIQMKKRSGRPQDLADIDRMTREG